jgi:hypothetical protein
MESSGGSNRVCDRNAKHATWLKYPRHFSHCPVEVEDVVQGHEGDRKICGTVGER